MDAVEKMAPAPTAVESGPSFAEEFRSYWARLPDKGFFFGLLAAWCVVFDLFGTASFNFSATPSLFRWMYNAWDAPMLDSSQGKLIPFVVAILLWVKRRELAATITGWWWPGLALLGMALTLHVFGFLAQQPRISIVALFFGMYSLVGLVWGWRTLKASFFPFVLFAFCMPFGTFVQNLTLPLQLFVTKATYLFCHGGLQIDMFRNGTQLFDKTGRINYDVAPACSGIRSFVALLAVTTIFSVLAFKPIWKRAAMIALTVPLVVIFNIIRLVAIILASQTINHQAGEFVHSWFGFVTYMMAVVCLLAVAHCLRDKPLDATA
ncbi:MAG TPA: exosortase/archaeosortase family protein [Candidatus Baltobacteraceae bacterium]|jgi:exosortase|nr:exosortase/archaeosortase family protein [Candidatus Baltobacteraceae bacterium]